MASSDDASSHRPVFFAVVIAAVFLIIIGMSVGLVFGSRAAERRQAEAPAPVPPPVSAPTTSAPTPAATPTRTVAPPAPEPPPPANPTDDSCRPETETAAAATGSPGGLRRELFLRTASARVWICVDSDGALFYHGNRGDPTVPWVEGKNALFLTDVVPQGDGYLARATGAQGTVTTFLVTRRELVITHADGRIEREPALKP